MVAKQGPAGDISAPDEESSFVCASEVGAACSPSGQNATGGNSGIECKRGAAELTGYAGVAFELDSL